MEKITVEVHNLCHPSLCIRFNTATAICSAEGFFYCKVTQRFINMNIQILPLTHLNSTVILLSQLPALWFNLQFKLQKNVIKCRSGKNFWQVAPRNARLYKIHTGSQVLMPLSQSVCLHRTNGCVVFFLMCLQEIRSCCSGGNDPFRVRHCSEELWLSRVRVFEDHNGGDVAAAIAVVRSRPHGDQLLVKHELVAFVDELMRPADQLQVVDVNKLVFWKTERNKKERERSIC